MTPEEKIKKFATRNGAQLVGIASVADINRYAPDGHRPDDFLIDARSVIVPAGRWAPRGAWRSPKQTLPVTNRSFGMSRRENLALDLAEFIEEEFGYYSIAYNSVEISLKLCAEMAGLGTRSLAGGIILNEKLGPLNVSAVITTMPLKADGPRSQSLCPHPSCVKRWERDRTTPCLEACPECLSGELENGTIKWMQFNRHLCATRAQTLSISSFQRILLEAVNEPDPEKRKTILMGSFFARVVSAIASGTYMGQCGECVRACPIVLRARTLRPRSQVLPRNGKPVLSETAVSGGTFNE